jgi:hypothetical protein
MMLFLFSCIATLEGSYSPPSFSNPSITDFMFECVEEEELWNFEVQTDAWTGNGLLWIKDQRGQEEEHPLISQGAPRDGSSDTLAIELLIVGDWRDVQRGKSTRWSCSDEEELSMIVEIYHPKERTPTDCITVGPEWPEESAPITCD